MSETLVMFKQNSPKLEIAKIPKNLPIKNEPISSVISDFRSNKSETLLDNNKNNSPLKNPEKCKEIDENFQVEKIENDDGKLEIPEVLRKQGTASYCSSNAESNCPCSTLEAVEQVSRQISYCDRKNWISVDRLNELRKRAQEAIKSHRTFTIRGCFFSIRNALACRGWVEKLDLHRKHIPSGICQVTFDDLTQTLPKKRPGETRRQYLIKCERNVMSRFLEHMPIDFLWTARKEKCDWIDQAKNPTMIINKFHRVPFTTKEGLCSQLRDFHWFYEEGTAELYFPRCFNVWSPEELSDFIENFRITASIGFLKCLVENFTDFGYDSVFAESGKIAISSIDFAMKRCTEFVETAQHADIDVDEQNPKIWDHDWDAFLTYHHLLSNENGRIQTETKRNVEGIIRNARRLLDQVRFYWPQFALDGYRNIWIVKPGNKCRGRGINLMNNVKKIIQTVNPPIASKSRYVVQKYIEKPLIIHNTKFDIRQWFLVTSVQPLIIWMYKESYLRFSSQEYNLQNYHESVHLTNHAVQKKYRNGKRDERLPSENMWDCYTFQAYLRQIGNSEMWTDRIYPGMQKAIIATCLASQENMDRRSNTYELFGADFMICEEFFPWLIEINSSPDLGATTSVTARMCPQCLEDVIKVVIDRKIDPKADTGNFELIYRQIVPPTPAYMGLNLFLKGKQIITKNSYLKRERSSVGQYKPAQTSFRRQKTFTTSITSIENTFINGYEKSRDKMSEITTTVPLLDLFEKFEISTNNTSNNIADKIRKNSLVSSNPSNNPTPRRGSQQNLPSSRSCTSIPSAISNRTIQSSGKLFRKGNEEIIKSAPNFSRARLISSKLVANTLAQTQSGTVSTESPATILNAKKFECIGNRCAKNHNSKSVSDIATRKELFELLNCKAKITRTKSLPKTKSTQESCTKKSTDQKRARNNSLKKLSNSENINPIKCSKLPTAGMSSSPNDYLSSSFYAVGMSLRAWRSRYNKMLKGSKNQVQTNPVRYKRVPPNTPNTEPFRNSPQRQQLYKNAPKKLTESDDKLLTAI